MKTNSTSGSIQGLVSSAFRQNHLSGVCDMLRSITESLNASACILWEPLPDSSSDKNPRDGYFVAAAQWPYKKQPLSVYKRSINSVTTQAVLTRSSINVENIKEDERIVHSSYFEENNLVTMCSLPTRFPNGSWGALNLFRDTFNPFTQQEVNEAQELVALFPDLYQSIRDKISFYLTQKVDDILHYAEHNKYNMFLEIQEIRDVLYEVCKCISETFQCIDTSIFMENSFVRQSTYDLVAATCPWSQSFEKDAYHLDEESVIGWILSQAKPIRIFDLSDFDTELESLRRLYPGLTQKSVARIRDMYSPYLNRALIQNPPPASFIGTPILSSDRVLGILCCSTAEEPPYYLAERELSILRPYSRST